jgi:hypothetical protein
MGTSCQPSDIDLLRHTFPSWSFAAVWQAAASGPDNRRLVAIKGSTVLSAPDADSPASRIVAEQLAEALREDTGQ